MGPPGGAETGALASATARRVEPLALAKKKTTKKKPAPAKKPAKKAASGAKKSSSTKTAKTTKPAAKKPAKTAKAPAAKTPAKTAKATKPAAAKPQPAPARSSAKTSPERPAPAKPTPAKAGASSKPAARTKSAPSVAPAPVRGSVKPPKKTKAEQAAEMKSEAEMFASAKAAAARLVALAGLRPIESRPFQEASADGEAKRLTKSPLSRKELDHYRQLLLRKRAEILDDVESMEGEALLSGDRMSHTPSHMAEQGSDVSSQSLSLDIAATQRKLLGEIDAAIKRIDDGTYGICRITGTAIGKARLDAKPWAELCIEAARRLERGAYAS